jgi:hypothetical protein
MKSFSEERTWEARPVGRARSECASERFKSPKAEVSPPTTILAVLKPLEPECGEVR